MAEGSDALAELGGPQGVWLRDYFRRSMAAHAADRQAVERLAATATRDACLRALDAAAERTRSAIGREAEVQRRYRAARG